MSPATTTLRFFESPVRKTFKKRFDAISDFFLAEVSLAKVTMDTRLLYTWMERALPMP
jgi:hypothetical protein